MQNDQISDFLTRIRNAGRARLSKVDTMNTKINRGLAEILVREGFLKSYKETTEGRRPQLRLYLRFENNDLKKPIIQGLRRASKPGLRRYVRVDRLPRVMSGFGMAIISTSKGVLTDREAREQGVGGEHICSVW
jgi:small subunit ribosomal protein S8